VTYHGSGATVPTDDSRDIALGIAVVGVFAAIVSLVAFFVLPFVAIYTGTWALLLVYVLPLVLSAGWLISLVPAMRMFGRPARWLLLAAPLALCWWWLPQVPGACSVLPCSHMQFRGVFVSLPRWAAPTPRPGAPVEQIVSIG